MELGELFEMMGFVLLVGIVLIANAALWLRKVDARERWLAALAPIILGTAFVGGCEWLIELPRDSATQPWAFVVAAAAVSGLLLPLVQTWRATAGRVAARVALAMTIAATIWLTVHGFKRPHDLPVAAYAAVMAGTLVLYILCLQQAAREPRLWALPPLVVMISGFAATFVTLYRVDQDTIGRMMVFFTTVAGLALATGLVRPLRGVARGSGLFLTVMFAVMVTCVARYSFVTSLPVWVYPSLGAGPLAMAVAWIPPLRKRPRRCMLVAVAVTLALVAAAVTVAVATVPLPDV